MPHLTIASTHVFGFGPLILLLIAFGLLRVVTRQRTGASGRTASAGPSALSLPVVVALIAGTTYLATMTANGAHAAHWISDLVPGVHGSGVKAEQTRPLDAFRELRVDGPIVVDFVPGAEKQQAVVDGDDNIVPLIKTSVSDGVLHIELDSNNSSVSPVLPMHVSVTGPAIASASANDAGTLTLTDVHAGSLSLKADGAATVKASGTADDLHLDADGAGVCDASKLTAAHAKVTCDGAAKVMLQVSASLDAKADAAANVTATGKADSVVLNGSGACYFHLKDLLARTVQVDLDAAAYAHVNASASVSGKIEAGSTLKIHGNPATVDVETESGSTVSRAQ